MYKSTDMPIKCQRSWTIDKVALLDPLGIFNVAQWNGIYCTQADPSLPLLHIKLFLVAYFCLTGTRKVSPVGMKWLQ